MIWIARGVALLVLSVGVASPALARCGDRAGDLDAVAAVEAQAAARCDCCRDGRRGYVRCVAAVAKEATLAGSLPRACRARVKRDGSGFCPGIACRACSNDADCAVGQFCDCPPGTCAAAGGVCRTRPEACVQVYKPVCGCDGRTHGNDCERQAAGACRLHEGACATTTTTTLPGGECKGDGECDDGNPCTSDRCVGGTCVHDCLCVGPSGNLTCCPGPAAECPPPSTTTTLPKLCAPGACTYFFTCGDPVCRIDPPAPPAAPVCTTQRAGKPCTPFGEECDPGVGCGVLLLCTDQDPTRNGCPISLRAYKHDVGYLSDAEVERMRDALLRLKLATYQYNGETPSAPPHLGFIIDDVGPSPAVAADGTRVDLYGYTTMAVAAIQAQAKEIAELQQAVRHLRARVAASAPRPRHGARARR